MHHVEVHASSTLLETAQTQPISCLSCLSSACLHSRSSLALFHHCSFSLILSFFLFVLSAGVELQQFSSYGSSVFHTLGLLFDSPLLLRLRPVAALYNIFFIVAWWLVLLPMLIILVIYAVRKTMTRGGEAGAQVLGKQQTPSCTYTSSSASSSDNHQKENKKNDRRVHRKK